MTASEYDKGFLTNYIKELSLEEGFLECGISKATFLEDDAKRMEAWLDDGYNAEMGYLERNREKRYDPRKLVDGASSVISVLYNYYTDENISTNKYKISKYAYGKDYHTVIKDKLYKILGKIERETGKLNARVFVDSAPVLDRSWALNSGLGFIGKNTMLINRKAGSYFFIGHIILNVDLLYDKKTERNYCGNCTACIDTCPTQAITTEGVNANKCISYLTIEHRGELPGNVNLHNWIFGCDICQEVCPWNRFAKQHNELLFYPKEELKSMTPDKWKDISHEDFNMLFKDSAVKRTGYKGLLRNINSL